MHLLTDEDELGRLQALYRCEIIDTAPEAAFDSLASLAAHSCAAPLALIGFFDDQREWFKARVGIDLTELAISESLDAHLLSHAEPLIFSDPDSLANTRFARQYMLPARAPIRFYANVPIHSPDGFVLGAIAVADYVPRDLSPQQHESLHTIADQIGALLELRALRQLAGESSQQALLADLGRRALDGEPICELMSWMTRQIAQVCGVDRCCILEQLPTSEVLPRASYGWDETYPPSSAIPLSHYGITTSILQGGQPIIIDSIASEGRFAGLAIPPSHGLTSGVILIIPGTPRPYGMLSVFSARRRSFTRADISFLQAVADLMAVAISQRWQQQILDSIVNLSHVLRRASTRSEMMEVILSHIHTVCHSEGAAIILREADGPAFVAQGHGIWADAGGTPIPAGPGPSWQVMQGGQPFLGAAPDFLRAPAGARPHAAACVALEFNDQPIGAIWVAHATAISYYDQQLLTTLADVIASAINRSYLHDQTTRLYLEHQQLTKEVRRAERHLASTVESAIDLVVSTDTDGRIITWNRAAERVSGFTREQMTGQYLRDLCAPAHQAMMEEMIASLIVGASFSQVEIPLISIAHQDVPISWRLSAIQSDTGESVGIVAVGRDLAEQRGLESQLFQAAKMASMGVMASGIGHELRNPLGIISANAQLAQERLPDQAIVRTCLQQIHAATKRAALIIDNLLTFARPRSGSIQIVDVNEVLAATFMLLDYQIHRHHTELIATLSHTIPKVAGNDALLQQVFTNLILNALHAMEGGGTLSVTTRTSPELDVEIVFSDTGCGIAPEVLPHIFDPFFTTRPIGQGTGLGLAISYSIIQQHGGTIEPSSQPGAGSTFCVRLPLRQPHRRAVRSQDVHVSRASLTCDGAAAV
jgi:PAS domain S-box-containing protein